MIDQTEDFQAEELRIGLFGSEFTSFLADAKDKTTTASGMFTFLNTGISLRKYLKGRTEAGREEYKFEFRLPDWLPASVQFQSTYHERSASISYDIVAAQKTASESVRKRIIRQAVSFVVHKPFVKIPKELSSVDKQLAVESRIGGFLGFGSKGTCKTTVLFR